MQELMCDMGCVALFGPAGFLALANTALGSRLDQLPQPEHFHPPWRFRLRTTLRHGLMMHGETTSPLRELYATLRAKTDTARLARNLETQLEGFRAITDSDPDLQLIRANAMYRIAYDEVDRLIERAWQFIVETTRDSPVLWTRSCADVPSLVRMLRVPAPPGELRQTKGKDTRAPCISAIANASWLFQLDDRRLANQRGGDKSLDFQTACKLILKAFENVDVRVKYDRIRQMEAAQ